MAYVHVTHAENTPAIHASLSISAPALPVRWFRRIKQRRALKDLLAEPDRILKDIGVSRQEVAAEAAKPFWRA